MFEALARWISSAAPDPGVLAPRRASRAFEAAAINRLTASWTASGNAVDADLRAGLDTMRARSRDAWQNTEYAVRFAGMVRANIVGPKGMRLMSKILGTNGQRDRLDEAAVEGAWRDFGRMRVFDVTGRHSAVSACHALTNHLAIDGELLLRFVEGSAAGNRYNIAVQIVDPARINTQANRERTAWQRAIRMGVEEDDYGRPVAYHMRGGDIWPASEVVHAFLPHFAEQSRGVPWMHAAIRRLHDLGKYREAAQIAAWVGAAKMGFVAMGEDTDPETLSDGYNPDGVPYTQVEAGEIGVLPHGASFQSFDPDYPHDQFDAFVKAMLRGIAAGLGVSYHGLANDLTDVNFSSIRAGTLEERDQWRVLQDWFADAVLEPIFERWLRLALLSRAILGPTGQPLPAAKLDKFRPHTWQPRTWEWVDPEADTNATTAKLDAHLTTLTDECAKLGLDLEDVLATRQQEEALFAKYGITRNPTQPAGPAME